MKICYVDESGGVEPEGSTRVATPLMVIAGLVLDHSDLRSITAEYLHLKKTYFPGKASGRALDHILDEVKATDLRRELRSKRRDERRHGLGFLDKIVGLLEARNARIIGRVWVKQPGSGLNPASTYTYAIQDLASHFNHFLVEQGDVGQVICDSRELHSQNRDVSHGIFTFKHRHSGDALPALVESPTFGISDNHAGLQIADLVAGALIFPMACRTYCQQAATYHAHPRYDAVKERYADRLRRLQHRYRDPAKGRWTGGIVVSDRRAMRGSAELFRTPAAPVPVAAVREKSP